MENGNYYVGKTSRPVLIGISMKVNALYVNANAIVESIIETNETILSVEMIVVRMMAKYGIEKVRGGRYSQLEFNSGTLRILSHLLKYIKEDSTDEDVKFQYRRIKDVHSKMFFIQEQTGLSYQDFMNKYEEYETNKDFLNFDEHVRLTRSKKREIFPDVDYVKLNKKLRS